MKKNAYKIRLIAALIIFVISILGVLGLFYPLRIFDVNFTPLFERNLFNLSIGALFLFAALILLTLLFGRLYCSLICPLGTVQELFCLIVKRKDNAPKVNSGFKYIVMALSFGMLFAGSTFIIKYIDPYTMFSRAMSLNTIAIVSVILILVLAFFKNRFFCSNICPVGAILGLISKVSVFKLYVGDGCASCGTCAKDCPTGSINDKEGSVKNETCIKCLKCISICPNGAMKYGIKKPKFNPSRRKALWSMGALAACAIAYSAGLNIIKTISEKLKAVILPAGAKNVNEMANKCLNCNLCVQNCPNKILKAADETTPVVHIDYNKGKRYCKYNCNKCSEVCPAGAIEKISLKQKQNTRIAIAAVNERCIGCGACVSECPKEAITFKDYKAQIDLTKCIGCGRCKSVCYSSAIDIQPVNEQKII